MIVQVNLVVEKGLPLDALLDEYFCAFWGVSTNLSIRKDIFRDIILVIVELHRKKLST